MNTAIDDQDFPAHDLNTIQKAVAIGIRVEWVGAASIEDTILISVVGLVFHYVRESLFNLNDGDPFEQARVNGLSDRDVNVVNIASNRCQKWNDLLVASSECNTRTGHRLIGLHLLVQDNIDAVHNGSCFQIAKHDSTVTIKVPTVPVGVEVSVGS